MNTNKILDNINKDSKVVNVHPLITYIICFTMLFLVYYVLTGFITLIKG
jgi:hypothetical protein